VSGDQLKEVNERWKGKNIKTWKQQPITSFPLVWTFEHGADSEGYWNCNHMALQLEDCVDVIMHTYPDYEYLFLFDFSSGHDKQSLKDFYQIANDMMKRAEENGINSK
jgi:hypothetical protein